MSPQRDTTAEDIRASFAVLGEADTVWRFRGIRDPEYWLRRQRRLVRWLTERVAVPMARLLLPPPGLTVREWDTDQLHFPWHRDYWTEGTRQVRSRVVRALERAGWWQVGCGGYYFGPETGLTVPWRQYQRTVLHRGQEVWLPRWLWQRLYVRDRQGEVWPVCLDPHGTLRHEVARAFGRATPRGAPLRDWGTPMRTPRTVADEVEAAYHHVSPKAP